ncbi:hypothetical protein [Caldilinea sp.]|uniref:hypothetical protein n=1 Tax=Caldilinea sp. TaxID=2293560 RepID=UPI002B888E9C|nr:hypothetical protein [Anaerolineales bacterium]HQY95169.1 hypothetical protein [Caldilinea sp.]HRA65111.1 hypothetical protein [Caldilinea sp.]
MTNQIQSEIYIDYSQHRYSFHRGIGFDVKSYPQMTQIAQILKSVSSVSDFKAVSAGLLSVKSAQSVDSFPVALPPAQTRRELSISLLLSAERAIFKWTL